MSAFGGKTDSGQPLLTKDRELSFFQLKGIKMGCLLGVVAATTEELVIILSIRGGGYFFLRV